MVYLLDGRVRASEVERVGTFEESNLSAGGMCEGAFTDAVTQNEFPIESIIKHTASGNQSRQAMLTDLV